MRLSPPHAAPQRAHTLALTCLALSALWVASGGAEARGGEGALVTLRDPIGGVTHVWTPPGYSHKTAGVVVYVHGYNSSADHSWREFELKRQLKESRQNALFVVPDSPSRNADPVRWASLSDLRTHLTRHGVRLPSGPWVAVGHSGAYRTLIGWVEAPELSQLILLDALYGGQGELTRFMEREGTRLILLSAGTARASRRFISDFPYARRVKEMPADLSGFTRRERQARLLYIRSRHDHRAIVSSGEVIPTLLRLTPLRLIR